LERIIGPEYEEALEIVGKKRKEVMDSRANRKEKQKRLKTFMESSVSDLLRKGAR